MLTFEVISGYFDADFHICEEYQTRTENLISFLAYEFGLL